MPEPAVPSARPRCTWLPMAMWTLAVLATLGLLWFVAAVLVSPVLEVRAAVGRCHPKMMTGLDAEPGKLGGQESAVRKIRLYLRFPEHLAPHKVTAVWILSRCDRHGSTELLRLAASRDDEVGNAAWGLLQEGLSRPGTDLLIAKLRDADPRMRIVAARLVGTDLSPEAAWPLTQALSDEDAGVRSAAAESLGFLKANLASASAWGQPVGSLQAAISMSKICLILGEEVQVTVSIRNVGAGLVAIDNTPDEVLSAPSATSGGHYRMRGSTVSLIFSQAPPGQVGFFSTCQSKFPAPGDTTPSAVLLAPGRTWSEEFKLRPWGPTLSSLPSEAAPGPAWIYATLTLVVDGKSVQVESDRLPLSVSAPPPPRR